MRIQVIPGAPAQKFVHPSGGATVPEGFIDALKTAAKFIGKYDKRLAEGQYVHVADGKAYASNNRHIVEIEVGTPAFKPLRLSKKDVSVLARIGGDPAKVIVSEDTAEFIWDDGQWVRLEVGSASSGFIENCKRRFDQYWRDPEGYSVSPKMVDLLVKKAGKGKVVSIAIVDHRAVGKADGFFFPAGNGSLSTLIRDRKVDPLRDDLFAGAIAETKDAQSKNVARIEKLRNRLRSIQDDIDELEAQNVELEGKLINQHEAIQVYQNGEYLNDEQRALLTPQCHDLISVESKLALQAEFKEHKDAIPEGWEVTGKRQDDDYIYITIRRERVIKSKPAETAAAKVKKVLAQFFKPGFDRDLRIRWDQLGTLSPIVRGAP